MALAWANFELSRPTLHRTSPALRPLSPHLVLSPHPVALSVFCSSFVCLLRCFVLFLCVLRFVCCCGVAPVADSNLFFQPSSRPPSSSSRDSLQDGLDLVRCLLFLLLVSKVWPPAAPRARPGARPLTRWRKRMAPPMAEKSTFSGDLFVAWLARTRRSGAGACLALAWANFELLRSKLPQVSPALWPLSQLRRHLDTEELRRSAQLKSLLTCRWLAKRLHGAGFQLRFRNDERASAKLPPLKTGAPRAPSPCSDWPKPFRQNEATANQTPAGRPTTNWPENRFVRPWAVGLGRLRNALSPKPCGARANPLCDGCVSHRGARVGACARNQRRDTVLNVEMKAKLEPYR